MLSAAEKHRAVASKYREAPHSLIYAVSRAISAVEREQEWSGETDRLLPHCFPRGQGDRHETRQQDRQCAAARRQN
jgi:hypothetical protein